MPQVGSLDLEHHFALAEPLAQANPKRIRTEGDPKEKEKNKQLERSEQDNEEMKDDGNVEATTTEVQQDNQEVVSQEVKSPDD